MTTKIEWVARLGTTPETWNPVTGCTKVSPGCKHCYAERMARRLAGRFGYPRDGLSCPQCGDWYGKRENIAHKHISLGCAECGVKLQTTSSFDVTLHPDRLEQPLRWKKPRTVFVCSMGDLFHDNVPGGFVDEVFHVIGSRKQHTFLVLTKRPERMLRFVESYTKRYLFLLGTDDEPVTFDYAFSNLWLGVTAENQATADERIPLLLQMPAAVRFVSVEPMLGAVDLQKYLDEREWPDYTWGIEPEFITRPGLDWVIAGGESGPGARPVHPDWLRGIRDQCQAAGVPFFLKQWGAHVDMSNMPQETIDRVVPVSASRWAHTPDGTRMYRVGKKAAGRLLDGREWNEWPEAR